MNDARFYLIATIALFFIAVTAGAVLTAVGMEQAQVTQVVVSIMGFAALIVSQYRAATGVAAQAVVVKDALIQSDAVRARQTDEVKDALVQGGDQVARKADEVKDALATNNKLTLTKAEEVKAALEKTNQVTTAKAEEVKEALATSDEFKSSEVSQALRASRDLVEGATRAVTQALAEATVHRSEQTDALQASLIESQKSGEHRLDNLAIVARATHTLVNANMGIQLKATMTMAKRVAELTKDPRDVENALQAEMLYHEHMTRQATVDAQEGTEEQKTGRTADIERRKTPPLKGPAPAPAPPEGPGDAA